MARPVLRHPEGARSLLDGVMVRPKSEANTEGSRLQRDRPCAGECHPVIAEEVHAARSLIVPKLGVWEVISSLRVRG